MGVEVETLEDLLAKNLRAVCVGINPSPVSVAAGHYYQGRAGQRFFARLREAGVIPQTGDGYEDDAALRAGIGFTDIVKRPTPSAKDVRPEEYAHGRELLEAKLDRFRRASSSSRSRRPPRSSLASSPATASCRTCGSRTATGSSCRVRTRAPPQRRRHCFASPSGWRSGARYVSGRLALRRVARSKVVAISRA